MQALRKAENWLQLAKFGVVGASGYVIYLGIYAVLLGLDRKSTRLNSSH